jgi:hypothetical protein
MNTPQIDTYLVCLLKEAVEEADCIVDNEPMAFTEIFTFNNGQSLHQYLTQLYKNNIKFLVVHQGTVSKLAKHLPNSKGGTQ